MPPVSNRGFSRRDALKTFAASIALTASGCARPEREIVPYVEQSGRVTPGEPLRFATTLPLAGYGRGVLGITVDGRPIKIEGNPLHPASLGATDVFAEAAVLSLYDPDRSRSPRQKSGIASWEAFLAALAPQLASLHDHGGDGLRLLTGRTTSPTLLRQINELLNAFRKATWHAYSPSEDVAARRGAEIAYGRRLQSLPHLERAHVVLCLDADPLGPHPDQLRLSRGWIDARRNNADASRVYVAESAMSLSGAKADERLALHPHTIHNAAIAVANAFGAGLPEPPLPAEAVRFVAAAAAALRQHPRQAIVLAGRTLAPECHALAHWLNHQLNAPVDLIEPVDVPAGRTPGTLAELRSDLENGLVTSLVVLDANPAYDAPALHLSAHIGRVPFSAHLGEVFDETARLCKWHVAASHPLESWSDLRAADGTPSLVQPLIRPLHATRSAHEFLAAFAGRQDASGYDLVRDTWRATGGADFEPFWRRALHDGVIAGSAAKPVSPSIPALPPIAPRPPTAGATIVLAPAPSTFDGSLANSAWLQECPHPLTKQVWGNALGIAPLDAARLNLEAGDVVRVESRGTALVAPVCIMAGHAAGVMTLSIGYGRRYAGAIGNGVGVDAYPLRAGGDPWLIDNVTLAKTGETEELLTTQNLVKVDGATADLYPMLTPAELARGVSLPKVGPYPDLYPDFTYRSPSWGMVIDTSACTGCNACIVACQAENNVPVVGPEEIARGRMMHWLRIDRYDHGTTERPRPGFQPVPCMHCEKAPCEPVCPVAASVHDGEGLNVQVYNRCVGTRFCEANCPYKVRRFNFFGYADGQEYANLGAELLKGQKNPDVTVRARGVMEKCTYCVQRISAARRAAERDGRPEERFDVVTACQSACPTQAIIFGDVTTADSTVARAKRDPRHYALLGHLGTRPRTTYLADLRNPDPALGETA